MPAVSIKSTEARPSQIIQQILDFTTMVIGTGRVRSAASASGSA